MSSTELTLPQKFTEVSQQLNGCVLSVLGSDRMVGFEKAYQISLAIQELRGLLTPEYMKPIMALQGSRLGFKTDRDKDGGYPEAVVKDCLIDAVLIGLQPFGNQFNIIAGNMYGTKEGMGELLKKIPGLDYKIIPQLPRINADSTSAAIVMKIDWTLDGARHLDEIDFPVKMNKMMGTDAVIGKATRKARAWLFNRINGTEIGDGDATDNEGRRGFANTVDVDHEEIRTEQVIEDVRRELSKCTCLSDVKELEAKCSKDILKNMEDEFNAKREELVKE